MKVAKTHSHLNGEEWLLVHEKRAYNELLAVIDAIDAEACRTKISQEKGRKGEKLYSPSELNSEFEIRLGELGWESDRFYYYIAHSYEQLEAMSDMNLDEQREYLKVRRVELLRSFNQTDYVKHRIGVEVQFGKYSFVAYDLFVKHLAFYVGRRVDVGIEILATKAMQRHMSSGPAYYEGELHNLLRHGRGTPGGPLMILGVEPE
jgi:hypothetical protein